MSWVPTTDLEEAIVSLNPEHNFIFNNSVSDVCLPRPPEHLAYAAAKKKKSNQKARDAKSQKLVIIETVQNIAHTKPLGEMATVEDWDDNRNIEHETIAMMRKFGIQSSIDEPLDEECTIGTVPATEKVRVIRSGNLTMPILFDEEFFKLKPRTQTSFESKELDISSPTEFYNRTGGGETRADTKTQTSSNKGKLKSASGQRVFYTPKQLYDKKHGC